MIAATPAPCPDRRTADVGRFDQVGRGALRDPQALDGEARLNLAVDDDQQRHAAHHAVGVGPPVDEADSRRALGQNRQRPERAVEMRQIGRGVLADEGEPALGGRGAASLVWVTSSLRMTDRSASDRANATSPSLSCPRARLPPLPPRTKRRQARDRSPKTARRSRSPQPWRWRARRPVSPSDPAAKATGPDRLIDSSSMSTTRTSRSAPRSRGRQR